MNRREFIAAGTGAFFISQASRVFGAASSDRLRFAIVGCHELGRGFAVMQAALRNPGVEIACVCDVDSRAMDFASDWLVKSGYPAPRKEKDFRKVLEMKDIDGVISETPDHFHAYSAVMAMRAGKAVYVEKPCAFCPAELEVILKTWKATGRVMQVGSQRRSIPQYAQAIRELQAEKFLGDVRVARVWYNTLRQPIGKGKVSAPPEWFDWDLWQATAPREPFRDNIVPYQWHWFKAWGTGECGNNSPHFLDVSRWALGEEEYPVEVTSEGGRFWMPPDDDWQWYDTQNAMFKYRDGRVITWECQCGCATKPYMNFSTGSMLQGTKGAMFFQPWSGNDVILFDTKGKELKRWKGEEGRPVGDGTGNRAGGGAGDTTPEHFGNFCDAIRANDPRRAVANAEVGVKSSYLSLLGNVAYYAGGKVGIDPQTGRPVGCPAAERIWSREYAKGWELA